ncbi:putative GPI anchored protein [Fonsecaea pedrosoi]|nr:putative GPI anchored protein [Fonsecaea pedrosoi]
MRFAHAIVGALCAVVAYAQNNNAISIPGGQGTLDVTAGQPLTIEWTNPSSGTVTIKLQQDPITPDSGVVLASFYIGYLLTLTLANIPASALTATLQIPPAEDVNSHVYTIEIIDDTNPNNINFSPNFGIQGATGTATGVATGTATSTGTATTSGSTDTSSGTTTGTDSSTITSTDSLTSSETTTASSSESSSSSSSESSASTTSSEQTTTSTSSASPTETTPAPDSNSNGAGSLKFQGSLMAMAVGLVAAL